MRYRINDFAEIKAYCDVFNEHGHKGFREPVNPFFWWDFNNPGKIEEDVHAFYDDGLIVVLETKGTNVSNLLVFALSPQKNILPRILDITKNYDIVVFNSEFRDRYRNITRRLDGSSWQSDGRIYYSAYGRKHGRSQASNSRI